MKRSDKEQLVAELKDKLTGAEGVFYTDFTGLNVKRMTELRRRFRKAGVEYVVIKNTLALRAVNEAGLAGQALKGPTGVVVTKDAVAAAKPQPPSQAKRIEAPDPDKVYTVKTDGAPLRGPSSAPITIAAFSDFQ